MSALYNYSINIFRRRIKSLNDRNPRCIILLPELFDNTRCPRTHYSGNPDCPDVAGTMTGQRKQFILTTRELCTSTDKIGYRVTVER